MNKKNSRSLAPEYLADLIENTKGVLIKNGITEETAAKFSRDISKQMCEQWGGQLIYFPYWLREELSERDLKIYQEFKGDNHQELSRKHHLSIQAIYRIVNIVRTEEIARRQSTLDL